MSRRAVARDDIFTTPPLAIDYDRLSGIVTIEGVRYHESVFKSLGTANGLYQLKADDGVLTIQRVRSGDGTCLLCGKHYKELAKHAKQCEG